LMPFQILAGLGLAWLTSTINSSPSKTSKNASRMLILLAVLSAFNYALRSVSILLSFK